VSRLWGSEFREGYGSRDRCMDKEAELLCTKVSLVQCKRRDARYLAMSYVCNLFALRLEDVLDKSGRCILNVILERDLSLLQNVVYQVRSSSTKYIYMESREY
jgi:hypothetical protein